MDEEGGVVNTLLSKGFYGRGIGLTGALRTEHLPTRRRRRWIRLFTREFPFKRLVEEFAVMVRGRVITVPAGFVTNYASTPWFVWWICPPDGDYTPAAVVHDWLYDTGIVTRAEADRIFLELMRGLGVPRFQRRAMYRALRLFGWMAWNDCRRKDGRRRRVNDR